MIADLSSARRAPPAGGRTTTTTQIIVSGGVLKSAHLLQRLANVLGRPVYPSTEPEASLRGAAVYALEKMDLERAHARCAARNRVRSCVRRHGTPRCTPASATRQRRLETLMASGSPQNRLAFSGTCRQDQGRFRQAAYVSPTGLDRSPRLHASSNCWWSSSSLAFWRRSRCRSFPRPDQRVRDEDAEQHARDGSRLDGLRRRQQFSTSWARRGRQRMVTPPKWPLVLTALLAVI